MIVSQELIFAAGLFATVVVLAFALSGLVFRKDRVSSRLRRTLPAEQDVIELDPVDSFGSGGSVRGAGGVGGVGSVGASATAVTPVMERIGHAAARPFMPKTAAKQSKFRRQLMNAGIYSSQAMELFVGAKVILLALGGVLGYVIGSAFPGYIVYVSVYALCVLGFFLPDMWLSARIASRRKALDAALPDALDLMVVCVESGLTLDASLKRVGEEIALAHPDISREFGITHMETRVGLSRIESLRNLGQRTGCQSLQSLAAMLVQTERFGTSIAQALRVHAESLRIKRQHAAEEQAAKTSVKLAFPVVLFIFPTLLVVLGGPAFILVWKTFLHK